MELSEADLGLAHALYRETDGNPFFVTEVLHHLADIGQLGAGMPDIASAGAPWGGLALAR